MCEKFVGPYKPVESRATHEAIVSEDVWSAVQEEIKVTHTPTAPDNIGKAVHRQTMESPILPRGYKWEDGKLVIDEAEAEKVRAVFEMFMGEKEDVNA